MIYSNHNFSMWLTTKRKSQYDIFKNRCLLKLFLASQKFTHSPSNAMTQIELKIKLLLIPYDNDKLL